VTRTEGNGRVTHRMFGLPISPVSFTAVSHGVEDLSAAHADVGEHSVVKCHQLVDGTPRPAPDLEPGEQLLDPVHQQSSDSSFGST